MHALVFWTLFTVAGIWGQNFVPGLDLLAPGLIVCLQEERRSHAFWLAFVWVLVQEGMGSLAFGAVTLLYACLIMAYFAGRWMFEAKNVLFVCLLGVLFGGLHYSLTMIMAVLQDVSLVGGRELAESLWQAGVFPVEWGILVIMYRRLVRKRYAHRIRS